LGLLHDSVLAITLFGLGAVLVAQLFHMLVIGPALSRARKDGQQKAPAGCLGLRQFSDLSEYKLMCERSGSLLIWYYAAAIAWVAFALSLPAIGIFVMWPRVM
jgi:hypothetical protein